MWQRKNLGNKDFNVSLFQLGAGGYLSFFDRSEQSFFDRSEKNNAVTLTLQCIARCADRASNLEDLISFTPCGEFRLGGGHMTSSWPPANWLLFRMVAKVSQSTRMWVQVCEGARVRESEESEENVESKERRVRNGE